MTENVNRRRDKLIHKAEAREVINRMLDCLLSQEGMNRNNCKECENVDACCFLMDAVFVFHYKDTMNKEI